MRADSSQQTNLVQGAIYVTCCYLCLALFSACAKVASETVSTFTVLFFQNFICFLFNLPKALRGGLKTEHPYLHLTRDLFGFASYFLFVLSVAYIPLTNAVLLSNSAPLWIPFIIWIWFKKKVPPYLWGSLILGFIGIVLILKPGSDIIDKASLLALVSGIFIAVALVAIRRLTLTEPPSRTLFYYFLLGSVVSLPGFMLDLSAAFRFPALYFLVGGAVLFYLVQIFIIKGLSRGKASTLSPLVYTVVLFSAILDRIFWHKIPDLLSLIGMGLVIIGGIISVYFEKKYEKKYI
jgi:drug/metabolite transporter (DMT)-like permease